MPQQTIKVSQQSKRSVADLFEFLSNHQNLSRVFLLPVSRIKDGDDEPNGIGSVRRLGPAPLGVEETVTAMQKDRFIEYRISRNGGPIQNHQGRLDFTATDAGCVVEWTIEFDAVLPIIGKGVAAVLKQGLVMGLKRVA
ncbi:MAG: SRPBCC family protein [Oceanococcus sp.]